jgi:protein ImuB
MPKRFVSIWFPHLATDWFSIRQPHLRSMPFVLRAQSHGRMIVTAANAIAEAQGIVVGMVLADARAIVPSLQVLDDRPDLVGKLLKRLAEWCIRFTPSVATDPPDGLILDASGCSHLWGGDNAYLTAIASRLRERGYEVRVAVSDTIGASWAVARFGRQSFSVKPGEHTEALLSLPPESLRLEPETVERLHKLGLVRVTNFIGMPRSALRRRFGEHLIQRLHQALGYAQEQREPVQPIEPYHERLPCLEPIVTATGIEIALQRLLETLCKRLRQEEKGLRQARFKCYRVDGKIEEISIGTNRPTHNVKHLFKLFELKISTIEPDLGIELFVLEAPKVEDHSHVQEKLWAESGRMEDSRLSELVDRLTGKLGADIVQRYLPDQHHWPERSYKRAAALYEKPTTAWRTDRLRPLHVLSRPQPIIVTAVLPDSPPALFRYKDTVHTIKKADGPERIEREWWLEQGEHRDYYRVEDAEGRRYWVFRSGHYQEKTYQWFLCGFFA